MSYNPNEDYDEQKVIQDLKYFDDDYNNDIALDTEKIIRSQLKDLSISLYLNNMPILFSFYKKYGKNIDEETKDRLAKYISHKAIVETKRQELNIYKKSMNEKIKDLEEEIFWIKTNIERQEELFNTEKENILKGFDDLVELDLLETDIININPKPKKI